MLMPAVRPDPATCVVIGSVAAALDGVDGWLARRTRTASSFGARFDMETDALLILVLSALVWKSGTLGAWVLASGLMRYAFVAAAAIWPWLHEPLEPSRRRQTICVVQVVTLLAALLQSIRPAAASTVAAAGLVALTWSFLVDILWLWRLRASRPLFSSSTRH
jgi:phosphatidylglycerophosphate synthase